MALEFEIRIKNLLDKLPTNTARIVNDGEFVADGYKPDRVYTRNGVTWIIEIESSTSRKGFIGGYLKAQKYFDDNGISKGRMLFIINEAKRNLDAVGNQISQYHHWLKEKGITVHTTYLMYDTALNNLIKNKVDIFSQYYLKSASVIR